MCFLIKIFAQKPFAAALFFLFFFNTALSQEDQNIEKFKGVLAVNFYPNYLLDNDSAVFTQSLLIVTVNKKHLFENAYFTDGAPDWQKEALKEGLPYMAKKCINQFAKKEKYTGILAFPVIVKSELIKGAIEELGVYGRFKSVFTINGKMLVGNVRFFSPIIVTAGAVIRCEFNITPPPDPFLNLKPIKVN